MEAVNGDSDKGGPPPPSPLTGCYLLIVIGEPHCNEHKDIILQRVAKGLLSWDVNDCLVDLEKELAIITEQALEGEEARYGERLIQFASENLVTEILIHPVVSTLAQCVRNLLSSFTRHRHIIHAGYTFANNGSWVLQDGTFSLADFSEAFQEIEVLRVIRAYENGISLDLHCAPEGDWTRLPKEPFTKSCKVRVNPNDVLTAGSPSISNFINYLEPFLIPAELENILESSDVVGNIRFSRPTLYVFPGGQGDAALFGINGFNMLLDGGFSRKACFWDFVRHLDRLDAVLLTRLNNSNVNGISAVLRRKRQNAVYPQIGHFFCNIQERKAILSPDGDKDKDPLLINLLDEGQEIVSNLRQLGLTPQVCYRDSEPINLYHKVGHGTLDMYVLSPAKDSKEVREFLQKWNNNDQKLFANQKTNKDFVFPLQNLVSICALLVWQPANPEDTITRILFPGSSSQNKIFEGLDKIKSLEFIKHPVCSEKSLAPTSIIKTKQTMLEKIIQNEKPEKKIIDNKKEKPTKPPADNIEAELKNGEVNGVQPEKIAPVKKSDSTESEKSISKPKKIIENGEKTEKPKPKPKPEAKPKPRSDSQQRKIKSADKKPSPTTPKRSVEKINGESKPKPKASPTATPAKSTKEANNRKVVESKIRTAAPKKEPLKPPVEKKEIKTDRKPISRRPKDISKLTGSPSKKVNGVQKPDTIARRGKLDKEGTTDSSTVSTPSADQDSILKKDISKLTTDELQNLKAQELADLKEEQEAVKEIEAVFRKGELHEEKPSDFRKIKDLSIEDKLEKEEYLIIEKTEIEQDLVNGTNKEEETQKIARDSEESEKQRKLSGEIPSKEADLEEKRMEIQDEVQQIITSATDIVKAKDEVVEASKEVSVTSPEDKIDVSTDKKDIENEIKETAQESQPDEKGSANIESGATTTAPTLPEDERMPLDEIKEDNGDQIIEEKHVKEDTKEKDVPVIQLPPKTFENITKLPPVVGIRLDKQSHIRDIVKTPDEVADLPVHEEVDIDHYDEYPTSTETKTEPEEVKKEEKIEIKEEKVDDKKTKELAEKAEKPHEEVKIEEKTKTDVEIKEEKKLATEEKLTEEDEKAVISEDLNKKELTKSPDEEKDTDEHELEMKKEEIKETKLEMKKEEVKETKPIPPTKPIEPEPIQPEEPVAKPLEMVEETKKPEGIKTDIESEEIKKLEAKLEIKPEEIMKEEVPKAEVKETEIEKDEVKHELKYSPKDDLPTPDSEKKEVVEKSEIEVKEKDDLKSKEGKIVENDLGEELPEVPKEEIVIKRDDEKPKEPVDEKIKLVKEDVSTIHKIDEKLQKLKEVEEVKEAKVVTESEMKKPTEEITQIDKEQVQMVKEEVTAIKKIDEKLQKLKEEVEEEQVKAVSEVITHKTEEPQHAEPVVITADSLPESPGTEEKKIEDKIVLGSKSPKEREQDVAKIVASVAEVLKSDAPLEEFEGKIPFTIPYKTYTTELRETHITTVESPVTDEDKTITAAEEAVRPKTSSTYFIEEERKIAPIHEEQEVQESKISKMIKDSNELMQATTKIIQDIKTGPKKEDAIEEEDLKEEQDADARTVHRMLVTASSEDGGEEIEICPPGTITFSRSSESSGRSSPDLQSQKLSQKSSIADTFSDATVITKSIAKELETAKLLDDSKEPFEETKLETQEHVRDTEKLTKESDTAEKTVVDKVLKKTEDVLQKAKVELDEDIAKEKTTEEEAEAVKTLEQKVADLKEISAKDLPKVQDIETTKLEDTKKIDESTKELKETIEKGKADKPIIEDAAKEKTTSDDTKVFKDIEAEVAVEKNKEIEEVAKEVTEEKKPIEDGVKEDKEIVKKEGPLEVMTESSKHASNEGIDDKDVDITTKEMKEAVSDIEETLEEPVKEIKPQKEEIKYSTEESKNEETKEIKEAKDVKEKSEESVKEVKDVKEKPEESVKEVKEKSEEPVTEIKDVIKEKLYEPIKETKEVKDVVKEKLGEPIKEVKEATDVKEPPEEPIKESKEVKDVVKEKLEEPVKEVKEAQEVHEVSEDPLKEIKELKDVKEKLEKPVNEFQEAKEVHEVPEEPLKEIRELKDVVKVKLEEPVNEVQEAKDAKTVPEEPVKEAQEAKDVKKVPEEPVKEIKEDEEVRKKLEEPVRVVKEGKDVEKPEEPAKEIKDAVKEKLEEVKEVKEAAKGRPEEPVKEIKEEEDIPEEAEKEIKEAKDDAKEKLVETAKDVKDAKADDDVKEKPKELTKEIEEVKDAKEEPEEPTKETKVVKKEAVSAKEIKETKDDDKGKPEQATEEIKVEDNIKGKSQESVKEKDFPQEIKDDIATKDISKEYTVAKPEEIKEDVAEDKTEDLKEVHEVITKDVVQEKPDKENENDIAQDLTKDVAKEIKSLVDDIIEVETLTEKGATVTKTPEDESKGSSEVVEELIVKEAAKKKESVKEKVEDVKEDEINTALSERKAESTVASVKDKVEDSKEIVLPITIKEDVTQEKESVLDATKDFKDTLIRETEEAIEDAKEKIKDVKEHVEIKMAEVKKDVAETSISLGSIVHDIGQSLSKDIGQVIDSTQKEVQEIKDITKSKIEEIKEDIDVKKEAVNDAVVDFDKSLTAEGHQELDDKTKEAKDLKTKIVDAAKDFEEAVVKDGAKIAEKAKEELKETKELVESKIGDVKETLTEQKATYTGIMEDVEKSISKEIATAIEESKKEITETKETTKSQIEKVSKAAVEKVDEKMIDIKKEIEADKEATKETMDKKKLIEETKETIVEQTTSQVKDIESKTDSILHDLKATEDELRKGLLEETKTLEDKFTEKKEEVVEKLEEINKDVSQMGSDLKETIHGVSEVPFIKHFAQQASVKPDEKVKEEARYALHNGLETVEKMVVDVLTADREDVIDPKSAGQKDQQDKELSSKIEKVEEDIEKIVEKGVTEVKEIVEETQDVITSIFKGAASDIEKEDILEKAAHDIEENYNVMSDMTKSVIFEKCDKTTEEEREKDEKILEESAKNIEKDFGALTDITKSVVFEKCDRPTSEEAIEEQVLEKTARDIEENYKTVSEMAQSIVFEKCEKPTAEDEKHDKAKESTELQKTEEIKDKRKEGPQEEPVEETTMELKDAPKEKEAPEICSTIKKLESEVETVVEHGTEEDKEFFDGAKDTLTSSTAKESIKDDQDLKESSPDIQSARSTPEKLEDVACKLSDKSSPALSEDFKDLTKVSSGKSTPEVKDSSHMKVDNQDSLLSGKSSPGLSGKSSPILSGSLSPEAKAESKDSLLSGKSSPMLSTEAKESKESLSGKSSPEPAKVDSKDTVSPSKASEVKVDEKTETLTVSAKSSPAVSGKSSPVLTSDVKDIEKDLMSEKPSPDMKDKARDKDVKEGKVEAQEHIVETKVEKDGISKEDIIQKDEKSIKEKGVEEMKMEGAASEVVSTESQVKEETVKAISEEKKIKDEKKIEHTTMEDSKAVPLKDSKDDTKVEKLPSEEPLPGKEDLQKDSTKDMSEKKTDPTKDKTEPEALSKTSLDIKESGEKKLSISEVQISVKAPEEEPLERMSSDLSKIGSPEETKLDEKTETKELDSIDSGIGAEVDLKVRKADETEKEEVRVSETKEESIAGPSTTSLSPVKTSTEDLHLSGKSTPDIADVEKMKEIQETLKHEKHIPGSSTPPTVPVSPIIKEILTTQAEDVKSSTVTKTSTATSIKDSDIRSCTPGSDDYEIGASTYSDISSGQVSRAPHLLESERIESDEDDDVPGSPMSVTSQVAHSRSSSRYDFEDDRIGPKMDPMNTSFYGALPDEAETELDFENAMVQHRQARGEDLVTSAEDSSSYLYEITKAKYSTPEPDLSGQAQMDQINKNGASSLMTASFMGDLPVTTTTETKKDPFDSWGKPLGLPSPAPPNDNRGTPKKERKLPSNVSAKNKLNDDKKRAESPSKYKNKKICPVYVDLTYVPHHGNSYYSYVDFFKRVRARYYVFSGIEPSREVYNALLEAKQTWEDKELEVTIIPTYDTDILGYWVAENEELLTKYKIDLSPSASRCTINLQDHETSCSAYRLEF